MSFLGGLGGFQSGSAVGGTLIRIGATSTGLRGQVRGAVNDVKQELRAGTTAIEREGSRWNSVFKAGALALAGIAVAGAGAVGWATKVAMDYETAFAGVRKTVSATDAQLALLSDQFRAMSREIPVSAVELASLGEAAGALGVPIESIKEFARVTALIGVTTNVSSQEAATALGTLSNVLKLTQDDYARFASTLVDLGNKGASTEQQILGIAERSGGAASLIGLSAKATLAFASSVASLGIEVEAGGSSLQNFFLKINGFVSAGSNLEKMAKDAGLTYGKFIATVTDGGPGLDRIAKKLGVTKDAIRGMVASADSYDALLELIGMTGSAFAKLFAKDPAQGLYKIIEAVGSLNAGQRQQFLAGLGFNDIRITRTLLGLTGNVKLLRDNLDNADKAWAANSAIATEASKRFETTSSRIQILKNRLTDIGITLGSAVLPGLASFVTTLSDRLPAALKVIGDAWTSTVGPALGRMVGAFGKLLGVIGDIVFRWDGVFGPDTRSDAEKLSSTVSSIGRAFALVADGIGNVVGALAGLLSNPVIAGLAKVAVIAGSILAAFTGARAAVNMLRGGAGSLIAAITGGRFGSGPGAQSPEAMAQQRAAREQNTAAAKQNAAADKMLRAAAGGGAGGYGPGIDIRGDRNPILSSPFSPGGVQFGPGGWSPAERAAQARLARQAQLASRGLLGRTAGYLADGLRTGVGATKGALSAMGGLVSRAFWPLAVASLGVAFAQGPIGDLVSSNTQFKRAGAKIKEDFLGGLVDLVRSVAAGTDEWVGHADRLQIGRAKISTITIAKLGFDSAAIDTLEAPSIENRGLLLGEKVAALAADNLKQVWGETASAWARRVVADLDVSGVDVSEIGRLLDVEQRQRGHLTQAQQKALAAAVRRAVMTQQGNLITGANEALRGGVKDAIRDFGRQTGAAFGETGLMLLSAEDNRALAEGLAAYITGGLDPRLLTGLTTELLRGRGPQRLPGGTSQDESRRAAGVNPAIDREYNLRVAIALNEQSIAAAQKAYNEWVAGLTPEEATIRRLSQDWLDTWAGQMRAAKTDKAKTALLAKINEAMGLVGANKFTSWDQLVDFQAEARADTKADLVSSMTKLFKTGALLAARGGQEGSAASFVAAWGTSFTKAAQNDTKAGPKIRAALLKTINAALPEDMQFKNWKALSKWFGAQVDLAGTAAEDALIAKLQLLSDTIDGWEIPKVRPPGLSDEEWALLQGLVEDGLVVNVDGTITRHKPPDTNAPDVTPPSKPAVERGLFTNVTKPVRDYVPPDVRAPGITPPSIKGVSAALFTAGLKIGARVLAGIQAAYAASAGAVMSYLLTFFPHGSPAERGPMAGVAWDQTFRSGQNIAAQLLAGYEAGIANMGGAIGALPHGATGGLAAAAAGGGAGGQTLNIDRLQLFTPADDRSILRRVRFMQGANR